MSIFKREFGVLINFGWFANVRSFEGNNIYSYIIFIS